MQAVSCGLDSIPVMDQVGCVYLNFGLWGLSPVPAWLVIKDIGVSISKVKDLPERFEPSSEKGVDAVD